MNYTEARACIQESQRFGHEMGLKAITILLDRMGNPQDDLKFIHIAGTNGKGSVNAHLASVLKEAGYRVGRFVSPTLGTGKGSRSTMNGFPEKILPKG